MRTFKKNTLALLGLMLSFTLVLAACSKGNNGNDNAGSAPSSSPAASSPAASSPAAEPTAEPLEPVTIKMFVPGVPQNDQKLVNEEVTKYLKDKINVNFEMTVIDWASWQDKMQLKYATNEEFDITLTMSWDNWTTKIKDGVIIPIDELMAKYAADAVAQTDPKVLSGIKFNGQTYGFPTNKEFAGNKGIMVRKDIAEKYGFDLSTVKTPEDMEPFFDVIKEKEPGMTPFLSGKDVGLNIALQEGLFVSAGGGKNLGAMDRYSPDLKIIDLHADQKYIDMLKLTRKWYEKGYINQDATTLADFAGAYRSGKVFAYSESLKPGKDAEVSQASGFPWVQIDMTKPIVSTSSVLGNMLSISRTSKNPERAMMFINLLHTDKYLVNLIAFGIEGKHYVKVGDNTIDYPEGVTSQTSGYALGSPYMFGNQFLDYLWANEDPQKWEKFKQFNESAEEAKGLGFIFNPENVKNEISAYNNKIAEFLPGLITGSVDPEEYLPKMDKELKAAGMDKINEEIQKQLDAWATTAGK
ncbi:ABC transporter substrate-binding protein [Cohnella sp. GCM10027633]|uniref:ABC transporter substrate-binding protein n=1 Tax=unclassified Cohnella TaxID=2636738 RepID=UPI003625C79B